MESPSKTVSPNSSMPPPGAAMFLARRHRHIVLVGPSGAGKTQLAPMLAHRLTMAWVDLDGAIERHAKCSIGALFAQLGEASFRALEVKILKQILRRKRPTVIAAGGGTWHNGPARQLLQAGAQEVLLHVEPSVSWARMQQQPSQHRPLVTDTNPIGALTAMAAARDATYTLCKLRVDASCGSPEDVADAVVQGLFGHVPHCLQAEHEGTSYPIYLSNDGPQQLCQHLQLMPRVKRVLLVADATVMRLFGCRYGAALSQQGLQVTIHSVADGEGTKSFEAVREMLLALSRHGHSRWDVVVGLGGGVVLDVSAFVAGIYRRGVPFVGVATTALAAVDASVGGKCGINFAGAKNQVGLIRAPDAVIIDVAAVMLQPPAARAEGAVEALKMGALFDPPLFATVTKLGNDPTVWRAVMAQAIALKIAVCRRDPQESGLRAALNYGHTLGHGFESSAQQPMSHGTAVALGMVAEATFAELLGLAHGVVGPLMSALRAMNMAVDWRRARLHTDALTRDKKSDGHKVVLPVVTSLGHNRLHTVEVAQLIDFVRRT